MREIRALGDRVAQVRVRRSMTQAELAERADVSVDLVTKLEQGQRDGIRITTLHSLARALEVPTATFFKVEVETAMSDSEALMPLRRLLLPGPSGSRAEEPALGLRPLRDRLVALTQDYHHARYSQAVRTAPALIEDITAASALHQGEDQEAAYRLLSHAYIMAASVLIQLGGEDLACEAIRRSMEAADSAGDQILRASGVVYYRWAFIRQGRFDDAERVAVEMAAEIEPSIMRSTPEHLGVWGRLMTGASAAAARNNRPETASELLSYARSSAARIVDGKMDYAKYWAAFGPSQVDAIEVENAMTQGDAPRALQLAGSVHRTENMPLSNWTRHLLAVAEAQTATRDYPNAIRTVQEARTLTPEWLREQRLAGKVVRDLLDATSVRRARKSGLAELASFVGVQP
ncbi:transcriptional regulator, XRE family [Parafrankia sp. EAN1pec]|uniref:helix-turn-helix domain-containing protein n=1 Tax=Parafrankia sp. (strain EAN1pec) TaxID=298653 RepID=UPI00005446CE|nr:transcriptional regulator, XRE family [Frankia sp. EAN1pec]